MTPNAKDVERTARRWAIASAGLATMPSRESRERMAEDLRVLTARANHAGYHVDVADPGNGPRFRLQEADSYRYVSPRLAPDMFARWLDGFVTGWDERTERGMSREVGNDG